MKPMLEQLWKLRHEFTVKFGYQPNAFLLGPMEYLQWQAELREWLSNPSKYSFAVEPCRFGNYAKLYGMDIRLKATPGIDLLVPERALGLMAMALEEKQNGTQNQPR